jgi:hypothetical protein
MTVGKYLGRDLKTKHVYGRLNFTGEPLNLPSNTKGACRRAGSSMRPSPAQHCPCLRSSHSPCSSPTSYLWWIPPPRFFSSLLFSSCSLSIA